MALCGLVAASLILPWTVRNYMAFGKFVPLNTNSGYAFSGAITLFTAPILPACCPMMAQPIKS
ncbi:MAG: hypothetical protein R2911_30950 [Caldilineaceae bacterium]